MSVLLYQYNQYGFWWPVSIYMLSLAIYCQWISYSCLTLPHFSVFTSSLPRKFCRDMTCMTLKVVPVL